MGEKSIEIVEFEKRLAAALNSTSIPRVEISVEVWNPQ